MNTTSICNSCEKECETKVLRWDEEHEHFGNISIEHCQSTVSKCCENEISKGGDDAIDSELCGESYSPQ